MTQPPSPGTPPPVWDPMPRENVPPARSGPPPPGWYAPPPPPPTSPGGQPLASFVDRLLAYLIDSAVFLAVIMVLMIPAFIVVFAVILPDALEVRPDGTVTEPGFLDFFIPLLIVEAVLTVVMLALAYVYYVEMMFRSGQTLGKRAMKIKIVPLDPTATLDRKVAAKRWLVSYVAASFLPGFVYLDGLWQLWDKPHQQCLHDKFARTVVVKVPA